MATNTDISELLPSEAGLGVRREPDQMRERTYRYVSEWYLEVATPKAVAAESSF